MLKLVSKVSIDCFKFSSLITSLRTLSKLQLLQKATKTKLDLTIVATPHQIENYSFYFKQLKMNPKVKIFSPYQPLIAKYQQDKQPILLIGECHPQTRSLFKKQTIITVNEICACLPNKVPLSYRERDQERKRNLQMMLRCELQKMKIGKMLICGEYISNWDEAYQLILDYCPAPLIIPSLVEYSLTPYELKISDFVRGIKEIHLNVSKAVRNHAPLIIEQYAANDFNEWVQQQIATDVYQVDITQLQNLL